MANLNPRHSEIGDLKVNRDRPLRLHLFTLHTGQLKVCPHHVFLPSLQRADKRLLQLHVESVSVYKAFQINLFIQFDESSVPKCPTPRLFGESTEQVLHNKVNQIARYEI